MNSITSFIVGKYKWLSDGKNVMRLFFSTYLIFLALQAVSFLTAMFYGAIYPLLDILIGLFVLYLCVEIFYKFEIKKRRILFLIIIITAPLIYLVNVSGDVFLGLIGNVFGLYFFALNLFIISISALMVSFFTISKRAQIIFIFIFCFIISSIFISGDLCRFYNKRSYNITIQNNIKINPSIDKNGKYFIAGPEYYGYDIFKLNPFYPDVIVGSDEGCGCAYWKTGDENEQDFQDYQSVSKIMNNFTKYAFDKSSYYKINLNEQNGSAEISIYNINNQNKTFINKAVIGGGYIRSLINERGEGLGNQYLMRSLKLFTYDNVFIHAFQSAYDLLYKEKNKKEIVNTVDNALVQMININK